MPKPKYKIIISDFHLGFGARDENGNLNLLEEFFEDRKFIDFLFHYSEGEFAKASVELVLNGDFLNHLHVYPTDPDADSFTEEKMEKITQKIIEGHQQVFSALRKFLETPNHSMVYIMGNHDVGVAWHNVQLLLQKEIGENLRFYLDSYQEGGVYIEHGNSFLADNRVDLNHLFLTRGEQKPLLRLPWGSFFVIHFLNKIKMYRSYVGKVYPFGMYLKWALLHDTRFALFTIFQMLAYFLKINFMREPRRNFRFRDSWKIMRDYRFPQSLNKNAKKLLKKKNDVKVVVFGHTHEPLYIQFWPGKSYLNAGTWNELISLDIATMGTRLQCTYVEILSEGQKIIPSLKEWKGAYQKVEEIL